MKPFDLSFDPFMGSGTTGVACKLLRRNFIGYEISKEYYELAKRRIDSTEWGLF
jgi:site-specific DNA-methyltransferase (adenine-specific)